MDTTETNDRKRADSKAKSNAEVAREIIQHISDAAIELAFVRHSLTSDGVDVDDDADVKARVAAVEAFCEDVKEDTLNCLTGDDTGCLDESELDESNCELLWLQKQLATAQSQLAGAVMAEVDDWRHAPAASNIVDAREG